MTLIYPSWGNTELGHELARTMIASVRKHMPNVRVVQETDGSELHPEADEHLVVERKGHLIPWLRGMDSTFGGDCIFCDTDIVFRDDITDLFKNDFDVAACRRTKFHPNQPYMGGFYLSRSKKFWSDIVEEVKGGEDQEWFGSQIAFPLVAKNYKVLDLDAEVYSKRPKSLNTDISKARVLHFRGRKSLMLSRDWS